MLFLQYPESNLRPPERNGAQKWNLWGGGKLTWAQKPSRRKGYRKRDKTKERPRETESGGGDKNQKSVKY